MELTQWIQILIAAATSGGVCSIIVKLIDRRDARSKRDKNETALVLGLAHDRIIHLGRVYIRRGYITPDEYENLHDYLWVPYHDCGGNGSAAHIMDVVKALPVKEHE